MNPRDAPQVVFGMFHETYFISNPLKLHHLLFHYEILAFAACTSCWNTVITSWMGWETCPLSLKFSGVSTE